MILLLQPPGCWDYRHAPLCVATMYHYHNPERGKRPFPCSGGNKGRNQGRLACPASFPGPDLSLSMHHSLGQRSCSLDGGLGQV
jgi:hypothetical protein